MYIVPIPPAYNKNENLDLPAIYAYVNYLSDHGAKTLMTTAGTSQFNLLTNDEINDLNTIVSHFDGKRILGIPGLSSYNSAKLANMYSKDDKTFLMALYPDRFYDYDTVYNYLAKIRDCSNNPIYLHAMFMRGGKGGQWDYESELVSRLFEDNIICGIKEEHSALQKSYDFVRNLPEGLDIIVAGGSMRRHQFLKSAGANSFLSGIGNFFPEIEENYCKGKDIYKQIELESMLFDVFNKHGWHVCLRIGLSYLGIYQAYDRMPWPKRNDAIVDDVNKVLSEIENEKK